jgi:hypothetical protein
MTEVSMTRWTVGGAAAALVRFSRVPVALPLALMALPFALLAAGCADGTGREDDTATLVAAEDAGMAGARDALLSFFALLHEQRYAEAAVLYGGDYDVLRGWNPELPPDDTVALWAAGCGRNGLECMRVAEVVDQERPAPGEYRLTLRFIARDGSPFVRGPCCGETEATMPSVRDFPFRVHRQGDRYRVQDLPIYVP